jgi:hypothetical protein
LAGLLDGAIGSDVSDFSTSHAVTSNRLRSTMVCVVVVVMVLRTWTTSSHATLAT